MRTTDDVAKLADLSPEQRLAELASIFAAGILQLRLTVATKRHSLGSELFRLHRPRNPNACDSFRPGPRRGPP